MTFARAIIDLGSGDLIARRPGRRPILLNTGGYLVDADTGSDYVPTEADALARDWTVQHRHYEEAGLSLEEFADL